MQSNAERLKAWRKENPEKYKAQRKREGLKRYYGITVEQWAEIFERQGRRCAICGSDTPNSKRDWHTDHCHTTGSIRGILCHPCNIMLGHARDNTAILSKAIKYLS